MFAASATQRPFYLFVAIRNCPTQKILTQLMLPFLKLLLEIMRQHSPALLMGIGLMTLEGRGKVEAATISIDLGQPQVLTGQTSRIPFVELNGTPIVGAASLDFLFKNNRPVRLLADSSVGFHGLIVLQTNGLGLLGFLNGTGYLIDAHGNSIPGYGVTGRASGNDGTLSIGVFPLLEDETGAPFDWLRRPLDFYGVHYDFTFPNRPLNAVIGGQFLLAGNGKPYEIGPGSDLPVDPPTAGPPPVSLVNISSRALVQTGHDVLIGGFIITGTQNKRVLLRAIGPSLTLSGKLIDPVLELHDSRGALIATNDNWVDASNRQDIANTGIAPTNVRESAILTSFAPGLYTTIVRGGGNTTGIALVECYDLDRTTASKFANISTRGLVQTGNNVLIGGFVVLGAGSQKVIVRAMGPSLPLADKLANPTLDLHDAQGSKIASNDNWRTTQEAEITAAGFQPPSNFESAIARRLTPGPYTAIVRGVNGSTGLALVEINALN
jgi:hypothetical protein